MDELSKGRDSANVSDVSAQVIEARNANWGTTRGRENWLRDYRQQYLGWAETETRSFLSLSATDCRVTARRSAAIGETDAV